MFDLSAKGKIKKSEALLWIFPPKVMSFQLRKELKSRERNRFEVWNHELEKGGLRWWRTFVDYKLRLRWYEEALWDGFSRAEQWPTLECDCAVTVWALRPQNIMLDVGTIIHDPLWSALESTKVQILTCKRNFFLDFLSFYFCPLYSIK